MYSWSSSVQDVSADVACRCKQKRLHWVKGTKRSKFLFQLLTSWRLIHTQRLGNTYREVLRGTSCTGRISLFLENAPKVGGSKLHSLGGCCTVWTFLPKCLQPPVSGVGWCGGSIPCEGQSSAAAGWGNCGTATCAGYWGLIFYFRLLPCWSWHNMHQICTCFHNVKLLVNV